jgi:hypothetical protein
VSEPGESHADSEAADRADQLPNPKLNPLMNPLLGQNLGRWAQVYFTSAPEKREQAVSALLQELESENPVVTAAHRFGEENIIQRAIARHEIVCPNCRLRNDVGHRFCASCGSSLQAQTAATTRVISSSDANPVDPSADSPQRALPELRWLREKVALTSVEPAATTNSARFWASGLAVLLLAVIGFWAYEHSAAHSQTVTTRPVQSANSAQWETISPTDNLRRDVQPAAGAVESATVANGGVELRMAQQYLNGKNGTRDSAQAAQWLWKALAKRNTQAVLLLADLYLRGDGVSKNCDQARLLLVSAAEKNNAEAAAKLRNLESAGCP